MTTIKVDMDSVIRGIERLEKENRAYEKTIIKIYKAVGLSHGSFDELIKEIEKLKSASGKYMTLVVNEKPKKASPLVYCDDEEMEGE